MVDTNFHRKTDRHVVNKQILACGLGYNREDVFLNVCFSD